MAKVIALQRGHDGRQIREEGEEFDVPESRLTDGSNWFVPANDEARAAHRRAVAAKEKAAKQNPPGAGPRAGSKEVEQPLGAGPRAKSHDDLA